MRLNPLTHLPARRAALIARQLTSSFLLLMISSTSSLCFAATARAQDDMRVTRITDFQGIQGKVRQVAVTPDGARLVYIANANDYDVFELFSVEANGGVVAGLSGPMAVGGNVEDFQISPDGSQVLFRADADINDKIELYEVATLGGPIRRVNGDMVPAGDVEDYLYSTDQAWVAYTANQSHYLKTDLYASHSSTGAVHQISSGLEVREEVTDFSISPDSAALVFRKPFDLNSTTIHVSPLTGGGELEAPNSRFSWIHGWTGDGHHLIFTNQDYLVQKMSVTTGETTQLSPAGTELFSAHFALLTPSGDHLVAGLKSDSWNGTRLYSIPTNDQAPIFLAEGYRSLPKPVLAPDQSSLFFSVSTQSIDQMRKTTLTGGPHTIISDAFSTDLTISPDGSRLVGLSTSSGETVLKSVSSAGGDIVTLNPPLTNGADGVRDFAFSHDGGRLVYSSDHAVRDRDQLYSVGISGGESTKLSPPIDFPGETVGLGIPTTHGVAFINNAQSVGISELFTVPINGGEPTRLSAPFMGRAGRVSAFDWSQDHQVVIFTADMETFGQIDLWSYALGGTEPPIRLNDELPAGDSIGDFWISESLSRVVYIVERDGESDLYSVSVSGGQTTRLDQAVLAWPYPITLSPDGLWVLYRLDAPFRDFYIAPVAGGSPRFITSPLGYALFSDDSQWLVYAQDQPDDSYRVYSTPVAGGSSVLLSNPDLNVRGSSISTDSTKVTMTEPGGRVIVVPIGGGAAVEVVPSDSGCNPAAVFSFFIPNSQRILYRCGPGAFYASYYSVASTGGQADLVLDGPELGPSLYDMAYTSDGSYWVASASDATGPHRLAAMSTTGGGMQIVASVGSSLLSGIPKFEIAPDDASVFYMSDPGGHTLYSLFETAIGSGDTTQINPLDREVGDFSVSPDQKRLFYTSTTPGATQNDPAGKAELVSVPLHGGDVLAHHPPFQNGRYVTHFEVGSDSSSVVYAADQDDDNVFDLYYSVVSVPLFADDFESGNLSAWDAAISR